MRMGFRILCAIFYLAAALAAAGLIACSPADDSTKKAGDPDRRKSKVTFTDEMIR